MHEFDSRTFRDALAWFATGVTIVTTRDPAGLPAGVTVNSFSSVSLDPPLVLFSLGRRANSLSAFEASGHFAINVLAEDQEALSSRFAKPLADKWSDVAFEEWETGCPILPDALASLECRLHAAHDGGDHVIFVGRVLRLAARRSGAPLLFCRGAYRALGRPLNLPPGHIPVPPGTFDDDGAALCGLEPWIAA